MNQDRTTVKYFDNRVIRSFVVLLFFMALIVMISMPSYASPTIKIHGNLSENLTNSECDSCHASHQTALAQKKNTQKSGINYASSPSNNIQSLVVTNVVGNITLITSMGQNWYQQGIYGPNASGNVSVDKSWGWTFFDETPASDIITPSETTTQKNKIYALLLDSGNNSSP